MSCLSLLAFSGKISYSWCNNTTRGVLYEGAGDWVVTTTTFHVSNGARITAGKKCSSKWSSLSYVRVSELNHCAVHKHWHVTDNPCYTFHYAIELRQLLLDSFPTWLGQLLLYRNQTDFVIRQLFLASIYNSTSLQIVWVVKFKIGVYFFPQIFHDGVPACRIRVCCWANLSRVRGHFFRSTQCFCSGKTIKSRLID